MVVRPLTTTKRTLQKRQKPDIGAVLFRRAASIALSVPLSCFAPARWTRQSSVCSPLGQRRLQAGRRGGHLSGRWAFMHRACLSTIISQRASGSWQAVSASQTEGDIPSLARALSPTFTPRIALGRRRSAAASSRSLRRLDMWCYFIRAKTLPNAAAT